MPRVVATTMAKMLALVVGAAKAQDDFCQESFANAAMLCDSEALVQALLQPDMRSSDCEVAGEFDGLAAPVKPLHLAVASLLRVIPVDAVPPTSVNSPGYFLGTSAELADDLPVVGERPIPRGSVLLQPMSLMGHLCNNEAYCSTLQPDGSVCSNEEGCGGCWNGTEGAFCDSCRDVAAGACSTCQFATADQCITALEQHRNPATTTTWTPTLATQTTTSQAENPNGSTVAEGNTTMPAFITLSPLVLPPPEICAEESPQLAPFRAVFLLPRCHAAIRTLLSGGGAGVRADAGARMGDGRTSMHLLTQAGYGGRGEAEAVVAAVELGSRGDRPIPDSAERTPLHYAALRGYADLVRSLIEQGANLDARDAAGDAAIHLAAEFGRPAVIEVLLAFGASTDAVDASGAVAVHRAADSSKEGDQAAAVQVLLERGAVVEVSQSSTGRTPLHLATLSGSPLMVAALLDAGAKVDTKDVQEETALHMACRTRFAMPIQVCTVRALLDRSPLMRRDWYGRTPLHIAAENGFEEVVQLLLDSGAYTEVEDELGRMPLHYAVRAGEFTIAQRLLDNGAAVDAQDIYRMTPLSYAAKFDRLLPVAQTLLELGADPNHQDVYHFTPIMHACYEGQLETTRLLYRSHSVDLYVRDLSGFTPLVHAAVNNHVSTYEFLITVILEKPLLPTPDPSKFLNNSISNEVLPGIPGYVLLILAIVFGLIVVALMGVCHFRRQANIKARYDCSADSKAAAKVMEAQGQVTKMGVSTVSGLSMIRPEVQELEEKRMAQFAKEMIDNAQKNGELDKLAAEFDKGQVMIR